ncbi:L,D-transpeptidase family protein [Albibacterium indicum]|uniref:L,D-transpeptidase family protein n=1 Tax=Albibacterium indicum TaxID=2292082 RepID=UPI000E51A364|nr:L,D-transpeptidase family protein [Pedobacter indicus]
MKCFYRYFIKIFAILWVAGLTSCGSSNRTENRASDVQDSIRAIENWNETIPGSFSEQKLYPFDSTKIDSFLAKYPLFAPLDSNLIFFYRNRDFNYAWFDERGLIEQSGNLVARVSNLKDEGVFKIPPYKGQLDSLLLETRTDKDGSHLNLDLELMLTAQYFNFAQLAWTGMDESTSKSLKWYLPRKKVSYNQFLDSLLGSGSKEIDEIKEPVYRQYELLKAYLAQFRELDEREPEWPIIELDKTSYKVQDSSAVILAIKKRMNLLGDFEGDISSPIFDDDLFRAVQHYQARLGLTDDGVIGKGTIATLNISPKERIKQIMVNMERCRWLPLSLQEDYLAVNIPEFKLHVYHTDSLLWSSNVVVGKTLHETVTFAGDLKYVVFSPYWNVPASIVKNEIVPAMNRNSGYLRRNNMEITGRSGGLPIIRQKPGPNNSLGLVKFLFPNSYNIYLHDTPSKSLFSQSSRAFSHGCVRVSEPKKLAQFLLRNDTAWTEEAIDRAMHSGKEKYVTLNKPVPVFITYFTAFVDRQGQINFRQDIYKRDDRLADFLMLVPESL